MRSSITSAAQIGLGLAETGDISAVARIYAEQFPGRVAQRFGNPRAAGEFYGDLFRLARVTWPETFFVARAGRELVGYLILALPGRGLTQGLLREGFLWRCCWRAVSGRYGFFARAAGQALRSLGASQSCSFELPHVYVIAVDSRYTGRGIGTLLLAAARTWCESKFNGMWLFVERENAPAIRLYERIGFTIAQSGRLQHAMVWNFKRGPS
jgi:ribosomal protein S18 acetylase RimI-like enzyme